MKNIPVEKTRNQKIFFNIMSAIVIVTIALALIFKIHMPAFISVAILIMTSLVFLADKKNDFSVRKLVLATWIAFVSTGLVMYLAFDNVPGNLDISYYSR